MPLFHYVDNVLNPKPKMMNLASGTTPNQFRKLLMSGNFPLPTICFLHHKGQDPVYLSRRKFDEEGDVVSEWDMPIEEGYELYFVSYPQSDPATTALIVSIAISVIIGVGTYLLTPRPNLNYNQMDKGTSPTYDLTQQGNKVRLNQPIPVHYGTIRCYPDVACTPFTKSVYPSYNYYRVALCVGQDEINVSDIRIDDTNLSKFAWVTTWYSIGSPIPINGFEKPMITSKEVKNVEVITTNATIQLIPDVIRASDINVNISSPGATIDGFGMVAGQTVLLWKQNDNTQNGVWVWNSATTSMTRDTFLDQPAEFINARVGVIGGTYAGQFFVQVNQIDSVGKDPVEFEYYDTVNGVGDYYILNDSNPISKVKTVFLDFSCFQGIFVTSAVVQNYGDVAVGTDVNVNIASCPTQIDGFSSANIATGTYGGNIDVLLMGQTNSSENGVYDCFGPGVPLVRSVGMNAPSEFTYSKVHPITGSKQGNWLQTLDVVTVGVSPVSFGAYDTNSSFATNSVGLAIYIQPIDSLGVNIGAPIIQTVYISGSSNQPVYQTFSYVHGTSERFKVKVLRLKSAKYKTNNNYMDLVQWSGLRGEFDAIPVYNNKTFLVIEAKATGKLNDSNIGIFNCLGKRKLYVYNFGTTSWSRLLSNEPVWAFWDMCTSGRGTLDYGLGLDESTQLDLANIQDIITATTGQGYECNARFDTALSGEECLAQIAQSMKCIVYKRGGKYLLAHDGVPASLQGFFTRTNSDGISIDFFTKNEFSATWFKVTYFDQDTNKKETVDCIIAGESNLTGPVEEIELHTITARLQAWKYGQYLCAQSRYHNTKVKFQTDMEGFLPNPLDHISFCHPMLTTSNYHGYVQKVSGATIYLSEPIDFQGYASGLISFKNKNGSSAGPYVCSKMDTAYKVQMIPFSVNAPDYTIFPFYSQESQPDFEPTEYTFGVADSSVVLVVKSITPSGSNSANIDAVIRDNRVYTAGIDIHNMPDYGTDTSAAQWFPYQLTPVSMSSNATTKQNALQWQGNGYSYFTLKYLYNNAGVEVMDTFVIPGANTPVTPTTFNHNYIHTYATPPSRVTITPMIFVSGVTYQDLPDLAVVVPITLA
jgi:hypothetical protein